MRNVQGLLSRDLEGKGVREMEIKSKREKEIESREIVSLLLPESLVSVVPSLLR